MKFNSTTITAGQIITVTNAAGESIEMEVAQVAGRPAHFLYATASDDVVKTFAFAQTGPVTTFDSGTHFWFDEQGLYKFDKTTRITKVKGIWKSMKKEATSLLLDMKVKVKHNDKWVKGTVYNTVLGSEGRSVVVIFEEKVIHPATGALTKSLKYSTSGCTVCQSEYSAMDLAQAVAANNLVIRKYK